MSVPSLPEPPTPIDPDPGTPPLPNDPDPGAPPSPLPEPEPAGPDIPVPRPPTPIDSGLTLAAAG